MSSRTYLSIGDVLTLLREEFPDVTISKIRFLESQGLVNPERSPSGYRKFFDHDVERLRWVLRQQREHFLPLKVIRDRLDAGDLDDRGPEENAGTTESAANGKPGEPGASTEESRPGMATGTTGTADTTADDEAMARILADASRRAARQPDAAGVTIATGAAGAIGAPVVPEDRVGAHPASESRRQEERQRSATAAASAAAASATAKRGQTGEGARDRGRDRAAAAETKPRVPGASGHEPAADASGAGRAHGQGPRPDRAVPGLPGAVVTGASLTAEELCAASSLSAEELAGLESYGLLESTTVAGLRTYDEDALTVANLAASFRAFGIEPRHLRQYRNAADREIGLIEQVVIPLLRQRNPESRQRAADGAEQLATLGQSMRSTLLRVSLRRHLGG